MDLQALFNLAVIACGGLATWLFTVLYDAVRTFRTDIRALTDDVKAIELLVAGKYATRDDVERQLDRQTKQILERFDTLERTLDRKADRL